MTMELYDSLWHKTPNNNVIFSKIRFRISCPQCLSYNRFFLDSEYSIPGNIFCFCCHSIIKINDKKIREEINKEKMKILDIPDDELRGIQGIDDGFEVTVEELRKADAELREFEDNEGKKYFRHILVLDTGTEYSVPKTVMAKFKKAIEQKVKAVEVSKTGSGLNTKYDVTFIK